MDGGAAGQMARRTPLEQAAVITFTVDGTLRACAHPHALTGAPPAEEHNEASKKERPRPSSEEEEP